MAERSEAPGWGLCNQSRAWVRIPLSSLILKRKAMVTFLGAAVRMSPKDDEGGIRTHDSCMWRERHYVKY